MAAGGDVGAPVGVEGMEGKFSSYCRECLRGEGRDLGKSSLYLQGVFCAWNPGMSGLGSRQAQVHSPSYHTGSRHDCGRCT